MFSNSVPETWAKFSNDNIQRSQSERKASKDMRNRIEQLLIHAANLMLHYWNTVNNAFTDKIKEQVEAKHKIQTHLSKVFATILLLQLIAARSRLLELHYAPTKALLIIL